ncbi:hypothetical protein Pyn_22564 [Prunus yedoensis var. nudiflora]|uniref:Uncharacterized protein n=1 Tax=Prunus yedoensis var. nudiflora TaxID=2094558 RepID=A0A314ZMF5_PRUYE|nr:hypothetical protein Pyn_22564 [Prunus yedoensis var. nudiflora]
MALLLSSPFTALHPAAPEAREAFPSFTPLTLDQTSREDWVQEKSQWEVGESQSGWETVILK